MALERLIRTELGKHPVVDLRYGRAIVVDGRLCDPGGLVMFTGPARDLASYVAGVAGRCGPDRPAILAAYPPTGDLSPFSGIPFDYLTEVCAGSGADSGATPDGCGPSGQTDVEAATVLGFDALAVMAQAAGTAGRTGSPVSPAAVREALGRSAGSEIVAGAGRRRIGFAVMHVSAARRVVEVAICRPVGPAHSTVVCTY